ncbi:MAG TPA: hypothetical protein IAC21_03730 [Candidatus Enterenecus merdae]|nr:hypothetical protein [Candidatus Enterenecus merdae]
MDELTLPAPEHQEVFQRVWARVMGEQATPPEGPAVPAMGMAPAAASVMGAAAPARAADSLPPLPAAGEASPPEPSVAQSQPEPDPRTARLRAQILEALEGWQFYRHLARRARAGARVLRTLAADQHRQARRLAAAYFLLTGVRYWPTDTLAVPARTPLWGALRRRHQAEQGAQQAYLAAAQDAGDPELAQLYQQLAQDCEEHCYQLRGLLEQIT